uniref:Leucine zipper protein 2 n=1 Tax=Sphenodon punctatus TaxID=8508 RepID=A0A8D0HHX8_SPHPU
ILDFFFCVRQGYEELERQLKEVFKERSNILHQLSKTSKELEGIKVNLQSLKNDEASAKTDVQKLLELGQKQREEMKSLQEAFQKQLNEAVEKAEKQQATINFLKTEMERKSKMIRDLQNENKSLKNKLLSGNKLCGIHAEEVMLGELGMHVCFCVYPVRCRALSWLSNTAWGGVPDTAWGGKDPTMRHSLPHLSSWVRPGECSILSPNLTWLGVAEAAIPPLDVQPQQQLQVCFYPEPLLPARKQVVLSPS